MPTLTQASLLSPASGRPGLAASIRGRAGRAAADRERLITLSLEAAPGTKAEGILKILDAHQLKPTKVQRGQVNETTGLGQLDRWFDRALTAATAAEVFAD